MAVALHVAADDRAVENVEGGEEGGGAMAFVVVRHRCQTAALHRQAGLGPVERLDLRFLVDRQHHRVLRRFDVEPDDILDPGREGRVVGQLELAEAMRRQTVLLPDPMHHRSSAGYRSDLRGRRGRQTAEARSTRCSSGPSPAPSSE